MYSTGGGGWAYCPHCEGLTTVFSEEWGKSIHCTVCDLPFVAPEGPTQ